MDGLEDKKNELEREIKNIDKILESGDLNSRMRLIRNTKLKRRKQYLEDLLRSILTYQMDKWTCK